jgi:polysaccharide export outer membrane protein
MMNNSHTQRNWYFALLGIALMLVSGCGTTRRLAANSNPKSGQPESINLAEGDVVKILFPGAPTLDTTAKIRRDGKITLPVIGEIPVVGMTPYELEKDLTNRYADQLVSKEINVTVVSSAFSVYVTGAVMHAGKIDSDRPITALEAIMEAGGPDYARANLKGVIISRKTKGGRDHYKVDIRSEINGTSSETFDLRPGDILYVPEKFSLF